MLLILYWNLVFASEKTLTASCSSLYKEAKNYLNHLFFFVLLKANLDKYNLITSCDNEVSIKIDRKLSFNTHWTRSVKKLQWWREYFAKISILKKTLRFHVIGVSSPPVQRWPTTNDELSVWHSLGTHSFARATLFWGKEK